MPLKRTLMAREPSCREAAAPCRGLRGSYWPQQRRRSAVTQPRASAEGLWRVSDCNRSVVLMPAWPSRSPASFRLPHEDL